MGKYISGKDTPGPDAPKVHFQRNQLSSYGNSKKKDRAVPSHFSGESEKLRVYDGFAQLMPKSGYGLGRAHLVLFGGSVLWQPDCIYRDSVHAPILEKIFSRLGIGIRHSSKNQGFLNLVERPIQNHIPG